MTTVKVGDEFYDKLPDGRYERCVLQKTDGTEPDRRAAARGGTGEFYRAIPDDEMQELLILDESPRLDASVMIFELGGIIPKIVYLERIDDGKAGAR